MDDALVDTFVRTGPAMLDFVEAHSGLRFEIATGFPDYKPELPGGQPGGGRSLSAAPFDLNQLGEWRDRITSFPADWSNVGFDAETRARLHAGSDPNADLCVAGTALIAGLLKGLLDAGVTPQTNARAEELIAEDGRIVGVRIDVDGRQLTVHARRGSHPGYRRIRMGSGSWSTLFCADRCTAPSRRRTTPATDCGWRWRTAPTWPTWARHGGCRSCRSRATRSTGTSAAAAYGWSEPGRAASSSTGSASDSSTRPAITTRWPAPSTTSTRVTGYVNDPAWMVFDSQHLKRYGFLGVDPDGPVPDWFCESADLNELAAKTGIDARRARPHDRRVESPCRRGRRSRLRARLKRLRRLLG